MAIWAYNDLKASVSIATPCAALAVAGDTLFRLSYKPLPTSANSAHPSTAFDVTLIKVSSNGTTTFIARAKDLKKSPYILPSSSWKRCFFYNNRAWCCSTQKVPNS